MASRCTSVSYILWKMLIHRNTAMSLEFLSMTGDRRLFCFDMEWLGNLTTDIHQTRIHSIAAVHCATHKEFAVVVNPAVTSRQLRAYHTYEGCRKITKSWLRRNQAVPLSIAFKKFVQFVEECMEPTTMPAWTSAAGKTFCPAILIAHGCFRADLPVLKSALRRCHISFPPAWRFFDSLLFFRQVLPPLRADGTHGYTLSQVAKTVGATNVSGRAHDALPDAKVLHSALATFPRICGTLFNWWQTPLTTVPGVGLYGQTRLIHHNICSTEDLLNYAQKVKAQAIADGVHVHTAIAKALWRLGLSCTATQVSTWCVGSLAVLDEN